MTLNSAGIRRCIFTAGVALPLAYLFYETRMEAAKPDRACQAMGTSQPVMPASKVEARRRPSTCSIVWLERPARGSKISLSQAKAKRQIAVGLFASLLALSRGTWVVESRKVRDGELRLRGRRSTSSRAS